MKRVVADTNVLVSALQFGGKPKQLLDLAVDGQIGLAISEAILEETLRVLSDKFHRSTEELSEADKQLRVICRFVVPTESIKAVDADPSDDRVLECAVAADAEVILSGDKHLLALESLLILRTLQLGPAHGHAIARAIELSSDDVLLVEQGSLYPALHRLIKRGWITYTDGTSENNRRAKFYRLTPKGRRQLDIETSRWDRLARAIAQVLRPASEAGTP